MLVGGGGLWSWRGLVGERRWGFWTSSGGRDKGGDEDAGSVKVTNGGLGQREMKELFDGRGAKVKRECYC